jgi:hypothetical protein
VVELNGMTNAQHDLSRLLHAIEQPIVCSRCADDVTEGRAGDVSMADYMMLDVGFSEIGLQVWCRRHDANVVHIDFEGRQPPTDFRAILRQKRPVKSSS